MCGIVGISGPRDGRADELAGAMLGTLVHRGPDGSGVVGEGHCRVGLTRLAIMDVPAPPYPFVNERNTVFCACNGQIYNSAELRRELEAKGHRFTTDVDTEVIVHLWEEHGTELVHRLDGMFAFAVWDSERDVVLLARDRAGEKPLFYWHDGERLLFASELRGLLAHPAVRPELDPRALEQYLVHGYIPAPLSPLAGIHKLPAGHRLVARGGKVEVSCYWDLAEHFPAPGEKDRRSVDEIAEELDALMRHAFKRRSRSDVPFGVFLSGGIDSSTLLAYLTEIHGEGVPVFTLGQHDPAFDEGRFAVETGEFFGADIHRLVVGRTDLEEGLRHIAQGMDEPLGDASTIPTHLLSLFAREHVKVVLSGEGADELFGGYPTYLGHRVVDRLGWVPAPVWHGFLKAARLFLPVSMGNVSPDYLLQRFAAGLEMSRIDRHVVWFGSLEPARVRELLAPPLVRTLDGAPSAFAERPRSFPDPLAELLHYDFTHYLPDDLLVKIDRATMLASLEARSAFLDHALAQFIAGIPSRHKLRGRTTKAILRHTVRHRLPPAVLERRKRGFNIPFSQWVLEGLRDEFAERFSRSRVEERGLFDFGALERLLEEHLSRRADHRKPLFGLLALDLWCDKTFGEGAPVPVADTSELRAGPLIAGANA